MINVVITTISVTKCIFLNFGAIPKRMVKVAKLSSHKLKLQYRIHMKFIYKKKINQKKTIYKQKKTLKFPPSSSSPTPHSPPPSPPWHLIFPAKFLQNSLRDHLFGTTLRKPIHSQLLLKGPSLRYNIMKALQCILNSSLILITYTLQMHSNAF